jgi:hypothetical protein
MDGKTGISWMCVCVCVCVFVCVCVYTRVGCNWKRIKMAPWWGLGCCRISCKCFFRLFYVPTHISRFELVDAQFDSLLIRWPH